MNKRNAAKYPTKYDIIIAQHFFLIRDFTNLALSRFFFFLLSVHWREHNKALTSHVTLSLGHNIRT